MYETAQRALVLSLMVVLSGGLWSCSSERATSSRPSRTTPAPPSDTTPSEPEEDGEDRDLIGAVSPITGTWRVALNDVTRTGVANLNITHTPGELSATGTYTTLAALGEEGLGSGGELSGVTVGEDTLVVSFNPTANPEELFTVSATRVSERVYEGRFDFAQSDESWEVTLTRNN